jgi:Beta-propeller repeat
LLLGIVLSHAATVTYSTYLGGPQYDGAYAVAVDQQGNAYVAGSTESTNSFPTLNPIQPQFGGNRDVFICKLDPSGRLVFSTYLGGSGDDEPNGIALDASGNIWLVGQTHSTDFPVTDDAFQPDYGGGTAFGTGDGFLAKLSNDGSQLLYASYFGGSTDDLINGIAIDGAGNVLITGTTGSSDLPTKNALQPKFGGGQTDGFIAKLDATLTNLVFSTYFGGENRDEDAGIAVDPAGFIYVSGRTLSTNFPVTPGAFQTSHVVVTNIGDNWDAFVAKLKPDGSALIYFTYVGDATDDAAYAIAADASGSAYVTGVISATWDEGTFPLGFQPAPGYGGSDAWVAKLKPDGSNFDWFSYLGGNGMDAGFGLALDKDNNVFVTGITNSRDFPIVDAPQPKFGGGTQDAFAAKISADGKRLIYSTYLGGSGEEWGYAVAPDLQGNVIAVGQTASTNFPIEDAIQSTNSSIRSIVNPSDAYVVRLSPAVIQPPLKIGRSGDNVLVSWATNFTGFTLEFSAGASFPLSWQPAPEVPLLLGGQYTLIQRTTGAERIYRLTRP